MRVTTKDKEISCLRAIIKTLEKVMQEKDYEIAIKDKALELCILENNDQEDIFEITNIQEYYIDQARKELKND